MPALDEKHRLILAHEEEFARRLAALVIEKPQISIWMILIPIIFVFHIHRHQRCMAGRRAFAEHYLVSRKRALNEALAMVKAGRAADIDGLVRQASAPPETHDRYAAWLAVLVEHYADLLQVEGDRYDNLVQTAYQTRTNYLLFVNQLNEVEKRFNEALKPHLHATTPEADVIVGRMENQSEVLRRQVAAQIFV